MCRENACIIPIMFGKLRHKLIPKTRSLWLIISIFIIIALVFPIVQTIVSIRTQESQTLHTPEEHFKAAKQYLEDEEYNYAFYEFNQAIQGDPGYLEAYYELGKIYLMAGEPSSASAAFSFVIQRDPDNAEALYNRALSYLTIVDLITQAQEGSEQPLEYDTIVEPPPLLNLTDILATDLQEQVFTLDDEAADDELPDLTGEQVDINQRVENPLAQSINDLNRAIEAQPDFAEAIYTRAYLLFNSGNFHLAIVDLSRLIELDHEIEIAYSLRAQASYALRKYTDAAADFSSLLELGEESLEIFFYRGSSYFHLEEYDKAIEDWTQAIDLDPENSDILLNRAFAYQILEDYRNAIIDYHAVIEIVPESPGIHKNLGDIGRISVWG